MLTRIITSIVAVAILLPVIIFSDTWIFPVVVALISAIGCYEMVSCIGQKKNLIVSLPIYLEALFFPLFMRYCTLNNMMGELVKIAVFCMVGTVLYVFAVAVFQNEKLPVNEAGLLASASVYIIAAFTCMVYVRDLRYPGLFMFLMLLVVSFATDIFAYFTGFLIGKHKLIPAVSPKKTVEGAVGGIVFCVLFLLLFGFIVEKCTGASANYLVLGIGGVFMSVISQIGDLVMSLIKRKYGIKDYGKLFPGHGGILDRCDSVLAVTIVISIIGTYFGMFN